MKWYKQRQRAARAMSDKQEDNKDGKCETRSLCELYEGAISCRLPMQAVTLTEANLIFRDFILFLGIPFCYHCDYELLWSKFPEPGVAVAPGIDPTSSEILPWKYRDTNQ